MVDRQIKFIWNFFGEDAKETAAHHARHLSTFFSSNQIDFIEIGTEDNNELSCSAFVVSGESNVNVIKNSLRPHRATIFEQ